MSRIWFLTLIFYSIVGLAKWAGGEIIVRYLVRTLAAVTPEKYGSDRISFSTCPS